MNRPTRWHTEMMITPSGVECVAYRRKSWLQYALEVVRWWFR